MSVKQISVFLENKPSALNEMTRVLAEHAINMRALSLSETEGFGIARLIVDDVLNATTVLKDAGYVNQLNSVMLIEIPDEAGGLNTVLDVLSETKTNIQYMYSILGTKAGKAYMVFRVDDRKKAEAALRGKGIAMVDQEDIVNL